MIRLHVIDRTSRGADADALAQHHALRRSVVEEGGCRVIRAVDAAGRDRFDAETTRYLPAIDGDGRVAGGTRLLLSDRPTPLSEIFPHLAGMRSVARGPGTWEFTRSPTSPHSSTPPDRARSPDRTRPGRGLAA